MLSPGDQIDIWVVEAALGTGGMGSVYRCHNRSAKRILAAIKVLDSGVRSSSGAQERFVREAEILYQLDHPNIVKVRNVRIDSEPAYIEMEFVQGESLERRLRRGALPFELALSLMSQMANAVAYLHAQGVCHRDIKPANVLIDDKQRVRIVDFGLALESNRSRLTQAGMTFGTVSYAPPEWITPEEMHPQMWDLYAMGVMFWEMLTGRVAFAVSGQGSIRQQAMQVIMAKQDHPPLDPGSRFHPLVRQLVGAMTHSDVSARIQTVAEVVQKVNELTVDMVQHTALTLTPVIHARELSPATWAGDDSVHNLPASAKTVIHRRKAPAWGIALAVVGAASLVVCTGALVAMRAAVPPPAMSREVVLDVIQDPSVPARIAHSGRPVGIDASGKADLGEQAFGELSVSWVVGQDCAIELCPGADCPSWCGSGVDIFTVEPGEEPATLQLVLPDARRHSILITLPEHPDELPSEVSIDGVPLSADALGTYTSEPLLPGAHTIAATLGTCPADAMPCDVDCPPGCASTSMSVTLPWSGALEPIALAIDVPEVPRRVVAPARVSRFVTHAAFSRWLTSHPDFERDAAIAAGRGDANYLVGWTGSQPPAGTDAMPVTNVSWVAANAYCSGRGGLPDIEADLPRSGSAPPMEFRSSGTQPKVLEDGERKIPVSRTSDSNAITGFRCAG